MEPKNVKKIGMGPLKFSIEWILGSAAGLASTSAYHIQGAEQSAFSPCRRGTQPALKEVQSPGVPLQTAAWEDYCQREDQRVEEALNGPEDPLQVEEVEGPPYSSDPLLVPSPTPDDDDDFLEEIDDEDLPSDQEIEVDGLLERQAEQEAIPMEIDEETPQNEENRTEGIEKEAEEMEVATSPDRPGPSSAPKPKKPRRRTNKKKNRWSWRGATRPPKKSRVGPVDATRNLWRIKKIHNWTVDDETGAEKYTVEYLGYPAENDWAVLSASEVFAPDLVREYKEKHRQN